MAWATLALHNPELRLGRRILDQLTWRYDLARGPFPMFMRLGSMLLVFAPNPTTPLVRGPACAAKVSLCGGALTAPSMACVRADLARAPPSAMATSAEESVAHRGGTRAPAAPHTWWRRWSPSHLVRALMVVLAAAMMLPPAPLLAVGRGVNPIWFTPDWLAKYNPILRYASIPMVAGLLNWATNRLAIVMMFYPLRFRGIGRIGWQGIVPGKAKSMANRIVDDVMFRLIDLRTIFARLPPERIATALEPLVLSVGEGLARDLIARKGWEGFASEAAVTSNAFTEAVRAQGHALVADFVRDVQAEPTAVFDLRDVVVRGVASDPRVLVDLFERCGEQDLRFVVNSGLVLGGLLGVAQMLLWIVFNPWWSLALTGAAVGMVTDQLALKLIFEPVEPKRIGPFTFQGLFLRRQEQVGEEFAAFMAAKVLTAPQLWDALLQGSRSSAFWRLLAARVDNALGVGGSGGLPNVLGSGLYNLLGRDDWEWLRAETLVRLRVELPKSLPSVYEMTEQELQLEATMIEQMSRLSSAEFERVLHPVFEEDEWTLILVGTALGGIAGAAQAAVG